MQKKMYLSCLVLLFAPLMLLSSGTTNAQTYRVRPGDSLFLISQNFGTNIDTLKSVNNLNSNLIYPGQTLTIPRGGTSSYTVQPGDSLFLIARRYDLSLNELRQANNIWHDNIMPGQSIYIPQSPGAPAPKTTVYTIRPNDSLYLVARRYGTTVAKIKSLNNLQTNTIYPGQQLSIPASSGGGTAPGGRTLSASDIDLLARLVRAEAEGESYEGQVAVAAAVLNRLHDPRYPNTIPGIIYQVVDGKYYQFCPVSDGRINLPATTSSKKAVQDALQGWDPSGGAVGFYNPVTATSSWVRRRPITSTIGNHVFFK